MPQTARSSDDRDRREVRTSTGESCVPSVGLDEARAATTATGRDGAVLVTSGGVKGEPLAWAAAPRLVERGSLR